MSPEEALQHLEKNIDVTVQKVAIAKSFILKNFCSHTETILSNFLLSVNSPMPIKIVLHPSVDPLPSLKQAASSISWRLSACEAVWGLISNNLLIPTDTQLVGELDSLQWTTAIPGSGGMGSALDIKKHSLRVPRGLTLPKADRGSSHQPLMDGDLYLKELNLPYINLEIENSLREAVKCFKNDLYLACLAMLGRASEGAWIELGIALAKVAKKKDKVAAENLRKSVESPFVGIGKKIDEVATFYKKQNLFKSLEVKSKVRPADLQNSRVWADAVRDSRNSIHYGAESAMSNCYEKVAALLIGAVAHLRVVLVLTSAALGKKA